MRHHQRSDGGFGHSARDDTGLYLGDNLAMARAFLQLYRATAERHWLGEAQRTAAVIGRHFHDPAGGYASGAVNGTPVKPVPQIDENISLARFANLLFHYTGEASYRKMTEHTMRYLARPSVATSRFTEAGILLIDDERVSDPLHLTVVGSKDDPGARRLYEGALPAAGWYKRIEWWDHGEGPLPNPDVRYPQLAKAAAFVCINQRCSLPAFNPQALQDMVSRLSVSREGQTI